MITGQHLPPQKEILEWCPVIDANRAVLPNVPPLDIAAGQPAFSENELLAGLGWQ